MRNLLVFLFMFFITDSCFCQSVNTPIYNIENNTVIAKSEFVSQMNNTYYRNITPYTTISTVSFQSLDTQNNYFVTLYRYNGWDSEAGDFQSIDIKRNNQSIMQLDNQDGWATQPSSLCPTNGINLYYEQLDSTTTLLYLVGYVYNSNPNFLTLILLKNGVATVVFNKEYAISLIEKTNGIFTIYLKDSFEEYIEGSSTSTNNPTNYKITWENGVLNFIGPY